MPTLDRTNYFTKRKPKDNSGERARFRQKVYLSSRWRSLRLQYLASHPLCELCEQKGLTVPAEDVHHRESFADHRDNWQVYAYSYENLMSLCKACHGLIHAKHEEDFDDL